LAVSSIRAERLTPSEPQLVQGRVSAASSVHSVFALSRHADSRLPSKPTLSKSSVPGSGTGARSAVIVNVVAVPVKFKNVGKAGTWPMSTNGEIPSSEKVVTPGAKKNSSPGSRMSIIEPPINSSTGPKPKDAGGGATSRKVAPPSRLYVNPLANGGSYHRPGIGLVKTNFPPGRTAPGKMGFFGEIPCTGEFKGVRMNPWSVAV